MAEKYDSYKDTQEHIRLVQNYLLLIAKELIDRSLVHDKSKLEPPEKSIFDEVTPKLKGLTYGSEEYKASLKEMGGALQHHYRYNSHHPEHYENGIDGMDIADLVEMICDWGAATMRHDDGDINISIEKNQERFKYDDSLKSILSNTVNRFKMGKQK
jgi:hypothetical protein